MATTLAVKQKQWKKQDQIINDIVSLLMIRKNLTSETLAKKLGMNRATLRKKKLNPSLFDLGEIRLLNYWAEVEGLDLKVEPY